MDIRYMLIISAEGILPKDREINLSELEKKFGPVQLITSSPIYLSQGLDEKMYFARRSADHPITDEEIEELKDIFAEEKRIFEIYTLDKLGEMPEKPLTGKQMLALPMGTYAEIPYSETYPALAKNDYSTASEILNKAADQLRAFLAANPEKLNKYELGAIATLGKEIGTSADALEERIKALRDMEALKK